MNRERFVELLRALIDGWEVDLIYSGPTFVRVRIAPKVGSFERLRGDGQWIPCPILGQGPVEWRRADMGQPKRHA